MNDSHVEQINIPFAPKSKDDEYNDDELHLSLFFSFLIQFLSLRFFIPAPALMCVESPDRG